MRVASPQDISIVPWTVHYSKWEKNDQLIVVSVLISPWNKNAQQYMFITAHQRSYWEVMFLVVSVILFSGGKGSLYRVSALPPLYSVHGPSPLYSGSPGHVQTCSLWRTDCWKAGGWHLTEIPSCFNIVCIKIYIVTILLARRRHQITQLTLSVYYANEEEK